MPPVHEKEIELAAPRRERADRPAQVAERRAPHRVVIVGGGAAGVITAVHLLRTATPERPWELHIVERERCLGPGLAYGTTHPLHLTNNYVCRMSAIHGDPDHLLRWCRSQGLDVGPDSFIPRELYGRYLSALLDEAEVPRGGTVFRRQGEVVDVRDDRDGTSETGPVVELADGRRLPADTVVLALGNPPPRPWPEFAGDPRYLPDPWAPDVVERVGRSSRVLLLGTGLTMVDVVAVLHDAAPATRFTAVSRHGMLPAVQRRCPPRPCEGFRLGPDGLAGLRADVEARLRRHREAGGDWRDVIDALRLSANELWRGLSATDQERFVAAMARTWEVVRHRMVPELALRIDRLRSAGVLTITALGDGTGLDGLDLSAFDRIINCTGPAPIPTPGWNVLVDTLLTRGTIRPHRLGLGLDLDEHGRVVDSSGRPRPAIYAVGAARRGLEWEVAAIPDLRDQAARLASLLLQSRPTREGERRHPSRISPHSY